MKPLAKYESNELLLIILFRRLVNRVEEDEDIPEDSFEEI
jgi:hypothetical protein